MCVCVCVCVSVFLLDQTDGKYAESSAFLTDEECLSLFLSFYLSLSASFSLLV